MMGDHGAVGPQARVAWATHLREKLMHLLERGKLLCGQLGAKVAAICSSSCRSPARARRLERHSVGVAGAQPHLAEPILRGSGAENRLATCDQRPPCRLTLMYTTEMSRYNTTDPSHITG